MDGQPPQLENQPPKPFISRPAGQASLGFGIYMACLGLTLLFGVVLGGVPILAPIFGFLCASVLPVSALVMVFIPRTRMLALGMLLAILVGVMILMAICFLSPPGFH